MDRLVSALVRGSSWLALFAPALVPGMAQAQTPQPTPAPLPSRGEIDPATAPPPRAESVAIDRRGVTAASCSLESSPARVSLSEVRYSAAGGAPLAPEFAPLLTGLLPQEKGDQSIAVVCAVRDRANAALRKAGYIASIQIPPQDVTDGVLKLYVIPAKIIEIRVQGELGHFRKALEPRLAAIRALENPTEQEIQRRLLLIDDIPGVNVRMALRNAGTVPGEVIGDLTVETRSATALLNFQNAGSRQLGREVASVRGEVYGLTGLADRTYVTYSNTIQFKEANILQVGHDMGIGANGLRVGVRGSYALSNPDLENLDLRSRSFIAGLDLTMPIVRSVTTNLSAGAGFEWLDQISKIVSGTTRVPFTRDRIRVAYARLDGALDGLRQDGSQAWRLAASIELRQGLQLFGATRPNEFTGGYQPSRVDGRSTATVVRGTLDGEAFLTRSFSIAGSVFGQWTNKPLLNLEEFSIGSLTYGRGYDPGANSADRAIAYRVEPRLRVPLFAGASRAKSFLSNMQIEFMGFYEGVRLYNLDTGTSENDRLLRSVGGGIRLLKQNSFALDVTYAHPLDKALSSDTVRPKDRVLVSLTLQLLPWGSRR